MSCIDPGSAEISTRPQKLRFTIVAENNSTLTCKLHCRRFQIPFLTIPVNPRHSTNETSVCDQGHSICVETKPCETKKCSEKSETEYDFDSFQSHTKHSVLF